MAGRPAAARGRPRVLVSAHRGGSADDPARENTRVALQRAVASGVDYVEIDVRRCGDGALVLAHEPWVLVDGRQVPLTELTGAELTAAAPHALHYEEALDLLAGRARVHLDLKLRSPAAAYAEPDRTREVAATARAVERLGSDGVVVTSGSVRAVRAIRDWSDDRGLDVRAGLTVGGSVAGHPPLDQVRRRMAELSPGPRFLASRANVVVANHWLALGGVARFARSVDLPLLVWTVDDPVSLRWWMRPGRAWLVTTNRPGLAMALRDRRSGRAR